ncbi:hypothetical protein ACLOJK_014109 [Asimina triloba]
MKKPKLMRFRLSTFPIIVNGPFGIVSAAELIGIILFSTYIVWAFSAYTVRNHAIVSKLSLSSTKKRYEMLEYTGVRLGSIGLYCSAFLFLPIARGSFLLRLIGIPFEHATRYHIWLGHVVMALFTLHSACYIFSWALQGNFLHEILQWERKSISNFPGAISLVAGLLMWVTSLHRVRKRNFELFFYTHQLYVIFIIFLALHVGDYIVSEAAGGIFLFLLDRFLRFCQSQANVDILSATCHPCGAVELILSKPKDMRYNALSFIFLRVKELSWLQWHPYSVSSSPFDGKQHLSIVIKVFGSWTKGLRDSMSKLTDPEHPRITASVEGPYGHESPYYLKYENLILVAGGIGISPFLAILKDILHRIREKEPCPSKVLVIWSIKRSKELHLLSVIDPESLCPSFSDKLKLEIRAYVTQEPVPQMEDSDLPQILDFSSHHPNRSRISGLVATGNSIWFGVYFLLSAVGFIAFFTFIKAFKIKNWWILGLLFIGCMVAGIVTFGGPVIMLWQRWEKRVLSSEKSGNDGEEDGSKHSTEQKWQIGANHTKLDSLVSRQYGYRPNLQGIFESIAASWGKADVGVIVCGPQSLQTSVAAVCRSQNIWGKWNQPIFHLNIHSFDL